MSDDVFDPTAAGGLSLGRRQYFRLYGERTGLDNAGFKCIWSDIASDYAPATTRQRVRVRAGGNAADAVAGTGAQIIRIEGIEGFLGQAAVETLQTAGASASAFSTNLWLRINRISVSRAGSSTTNVGDVALEWETAPVTNAAFILAGQGASQQAFYTAPFGQPLPRAEWGGCAQFLCGSLYVNVSGGQKADVRLIRRRGEITVGVHTIEVLQNFPNLPLGISRLEVGAPLLIKGATDNLQFDSSTGHDFNCIDLALQANAASATTNVQAAIAGYFAVQGR